jgi:hypothetical protein
VAMSKPRERLRPLTYDSLSVKQRLNRWRKDRKVPAEGHHERYTIVAREVMPPNPDLTVTGVIPLCRGQRVNRRTAPCGDARRRTGDRNQRRNL